MSKVYHLPIRHLRWRISKFFLGKTFSLHHFFAIFIIYLKLIIFSTRVKSRKWQTSAPCKTTGKGKGTTVKYARFLCTIALCIALEAAGQPSVPPQETWITVFIHGIISVQPFISLPNIFRFKRDCVCDCMYEETVSLIRHDPFFRKAQAMQDIGLQTINMLDTSAASLVARTIDSINQVVYPHQKCFYYTFGWSGLLSPSKRFEAAYQLYTELAAECAKFQAQGISPRVRLITYSHGGNVGLNLAAVKNNYPSLPDLAIDELVMFGIPILRETDHLVGHTIFKQAYNFYSLGDRVQPLDCFAGKRSHRRFEPHNTFELPNNLIQVELRVTRLAKGKQSPLSIDEQLKNRAYIVGSAHYLKNTSPGHSELWFYSWTPTLYRQSYPLNPLPTVAITPLLTHSVKTYLKEYPSADTQNLIVDVRPQHDMILTRAKGDYQDYTREPFIPKELFEDLKQLALENKPEDVTKKASQEHFNAACSQGKKLHEKRLRERYTHR